MSKGIPLFERDASEIPFPLEVAFCGYTLKTSADKCDTSMRKEVVGLNRSNLLQSELAHVTMTAAALPSHFGRMHYETGAPSLASTFPAVAASFSDCSSFCLVIRAVSASIARMSSMVRPNHSSIQQKSFL